MGFVKPYKKVSKEKYRKDMQELAEQKQKKGKGSKGVSDKKAQAEYFERHPFCEVCFHEGKGRIPADDVHEIKYKSQGGECTEDNMVSLTREKHDEAHFKKKPYLHKDRLIAAKKAVEKILKDEITYGRGME